MKAPIIFAGISITVAEAEKLMPQARVLPPAHRGDIARAVKNGAREIYLLDGTMVYDYPPSPSEVAEALTDGVRIIGASSLGALRAVELRAHPLMHGIGWVYESVLSGRLVGDDELTARIDPISGLPSNLFLANVLYGCLQLQAQGCLTRRQADAIVTGLRQVYFEDRTAALLLRLASVAGVSQSIVELLMHQQFNVKRLDALACLKGGIS
jgi:hypothetical protein